jgi:hypothetical protein
MARKTKPSSAPESNAARSRPADLPSVNPYAKQGKQILGHRVYDEFHQRLRSFVGTLNDQGFETTQAELLNGVLHFGAPPNAEKAAELLLEWRQVRAAPPPDAKP